MSKYKNTGATTIDYNADEMSVTIDCIHSSHEGKTSKIGIVEESVVDLTACKAHSG